MVSSLKTIADPFPNPAEWVAVRHASQVLSTIKDVSAMIEAGIVPEDASTELLHGVLLYVDRGATVDPAVDPRQHVRRSHLKEGEIAEGADHNYVVSGLADLVPVINSPLRHLRTQSTFICSETHAPIPDGIVLRGPRTDYRGKRPTAADAFCVIEVADSSYERDAGEKLFGYARAGIPRYIIINLRNRTAEVYTNPDLSVGTYSLPEVLASQQSFLVRVGESESFSIALADLLP